MTVRPLLTVCAIVLGNGASWADDIAVEIVPVEERPLTFEIKLTGTIAAQDSIDLSFPAGGRITSILVQAGDRVTGGYALARSDNVQQQQALVQALAGVEAAEAAEQQAAQAATRTAGLLQRGVGTRAAADAVLTARTAAEARAAAERILAER